MKNCTAFIAVIALYGVAVFASCKPNNQPMHNQGHTNPIEIETVVNNLEDLSDKINDHIYDAKGNEKDGLKYKTLEELFNDLIKQEELVANYKEKAQQALKAIGNTLNAIIDGTLRKVQANRLKYKSNREKLDAIEHEAIEIEKKYKETNKIAEQLSNIGVLRNRQKSADEAANKVKKNARAIVKLKHKINLTNAKLKNNKVDELFQKTKSLEGATKSLKTNIRKLDETRVELKKIENAINKIEKEVQTIPPLLAAADGSTSDLTNNTSGVIIENNNSDSFKDAFDKLLHSIRHFKRRFPEAPPSQPNQHENQEMGLGRQTSASSVDEPHSVASVTTTAPTHTNTSSSGILIDPEDKK